ncbi:excinuclease ABC subunit UvrC [Candidatus Saccharibacteria bacterium]|nr:excinuclease ABC subunit UvrC [Candidatus Saccharibacteria bacterium]
MSKKLENKLAKLPSSPGVYFHKNAAGEIIYIGKAANLRNRVRQYFHPSTSLRVADAKTAALIKEVADIDWTPVETEVDALFLEAEMVRRYMPPYNILLRDDKSLSYVRIDYKSDYPTVTFSRRPLDDGAQYFGPYISTFEVKKALRFLRRAFPYAISKPLNQSASRRRASLHYHLGLDPGLEEDRTSLEDYRANLRKLMQYLRGNRVALVREIGRDMKRAAKAKDFETAAKLRNQLFSLQALNRQVIFSDHETLDASKDLALTELTQLLKLKEPPRRIEGFDISHIQGTDTTASLVVFINGVPCKTDYRKFKMRLPGNDDFAHMREAVSRRFREVNRRKWGIPDLVLIDGGKGQLSAAMQARNNANLSQIPMIGLAKRFEEVIISKNNTYEVINLPANSHLVKLLQRIRDESHRFAISYHSTLRAHRQTASQLDDIPGIGPVTRKKLIKRFGSTRGVVVASKADLRQVIGPKMAKALAKYFAVMK